jgi:membrane protein implicated in regulation of membrane protease activity
VNYLKGKAVKDETLTVILFCLIVGGAIVLTAMAIAAGFNSAMVALACLVVAFVVIVSIHFHLLGKSRRPERQPDRA